MKFTITKRTMLSWTAFLIGGISILFGGQHTYTILLQDNNYDRNLIFLLSTGGILIFCGLLNIIMTTGVKKNIKLANIVSVLSSLFLLTFCLSLTPFFKNDLNLFLILIHIIYLFLFTVVSLIEKLSKKPE